jgi:D-psicose/D-tagatose/L-ribulose 3-epimerase
MQIGAHALVFTGIFDRVGLEKAISSTKTAGFDLIEIPLMNTETFDKKLAARLLQEYDLSVSASLGLNDSTDLTSSDPAVVRAGEQLLTECLNILHVMGGAQLCGVIYSAMKKYMEPVECCCDPPLGDSGGRLGNSPVSRSRQPL